MKPGEDANGDHKVEMGGRKRQGVNVRMLHSHTISDAGLGDPLGSGAHHRLACAHGIDEEATFREPHGQVAGAASDLQRARATLERARGDEGQDDILAALVDEALQVGTPIDSVPIRRRRVEVLFYVPLKITSCADASRRVLDALPLDPSMGSHLASRRRQPAHRVICALSDKFAANRKRVNRYALPTASGVTKLSIYLAPTSTSGSQVLKVIIYADNGGAPGALLGVSERLTFTSASSAGWYDLVFPSPIKLAAGNYWIGVITGASSSVAGFRYDSVSGSRDYNANTYTSGPTNPFGSFTTDSEQMSLYATYTPAAETQSPAQASGHYEYVFPANAIDVYNLDKVHSSSRPSASRRRPTSAAPRRTRRPTCSTSATAGTAARTAAARCSPTTCSPTKPCGRTPIRKAWTSSAPTQVADIKLTRQMSGSQVGCTYDCLREGWLQHTLDGRIVLVGDSGDVIETATRRSVANLEPLYNSRVFLEIDWSNGAPVATSTRSGLGYVTK